METFGTYLKLLLWNKGIRAIDLAKAINMSPATLTKYFKQSTVPDRDAFGRILDYLHTFLDQDEEMRLLDLFIEEKSGIDMGLMENAIVVADPLDRLILEELKHLKESQKEALIKQLRKTSHDNLEEIGYLDGQFLLEGVNEQRAAYNAKPAAPAQRVNKNAATAHPYRKKTYNP